VEGRLRVPGGPGLGVNVDHEFLASITHATEMVQAERKTARAAR
jgi:hypothetical protein